jgi:hypothetical protein
MLEIMICLCRVLVLAEILGAGSLRSSPLLTAGAEQARLIGDCGFAHNALLAIRTPGNNCSSMGPKKYLQL